MSLRPVRSFTARKNCPSPADCPAGKRGPCPACHRADPEVRSRMSEARKRAWADPEVRARMKAARRGAAGVELPRWLPESLHDEYLDLAAEFDEETAASVCRRLKRDMAA